jgi:hypothetical protein
MHISFFAAMAMLRAPTSLWKWGIASWAMASFPGLFRKPIYPLSQGLARERMPRIATPAIDASRAIGKLPVPEKRAWIFFNRKERGSPSSIFRPRVKIATSRSF